MALIVRFDGTHWVDELGRAWDDQIRFSLPDKDVFVLDANADPPAQLAGAAGLYQGFGTILYNMVVNPVNGKVYVSNTEAGNEKRFEGPGIFAGHSVPGHLHESRVTVLGAAAPPAAAARPSPPAHPPQSRITVLGPAGSVAPRHLNKHIDYAACCDTIPNAENDKSLALPQEMEVTADGRTLHLAARGSAP